MTKTVLPVSNVKLLRLFLSVVGVLILLGSILFIKGQLETWPLSIILVVAKSILILIFSIVVLSTSITMILLPFVENGFVKSVAQKLIWPVEQFVVLGNYFTFGAAPFVTGLFIFGITYICIILLIALKVIPLISVEAVLYLSLVMTSIIFIYTGKQIVKMILRLNNKEWNYDKLLQLLTPNRIRVYIYGIALIAYVISNLEKFSDAPILPISWWGVHKDIAVEVLLTIGVFDALLAIWKERRSE
jgi:hypothetical protein